ncbi:MAG: tRNA pseudouridine(38-40) synthase TruA [Burkholderiaceae bacterium]
MIRYALVIAYDGRSFAGWQTQPSGQTVQDHLERALARIAGRPIATICAGRTDAGVHASRQVVHFDCEVERPLTAWVRGVNAFLPDAIAVQASAVAPAGFHARFSAVRRRYRYRLYRAPQRHPLLAGRAGWVHRRLDIDAMRAAAGCLIGRHDFSAFRSSECQAASPVRELQALRLTERGAIVEIELVANAFLHHMVRNIVGALVWIGIGRRPPNWLAQVLAARDRRLAAPTFAADGLYLTGVDYGQTAPDLLTWPAGECDDPDDHGEAARYSLGA